MSELNKVFGVSMQVGNSIYKKLVAAKGNINVILDDLANMIDEHRIVKIVGNKNATGSKVDGEEALRKFR